MSDFANDVKFSMKVVINKQTTKVLFAEIDSDIADVLFSFLTLPLGAIVGILKKQYGDKAPVFGSITTLYDGLSNLESSHFWTEGGKQMLLNPLKKEISVRNVPKAVDGEVFTIGTATFIISDDLRILPNVTESVRQIISDLGLMGIDGTELRDVTIGFIEIMDLLKHSLLSPTPLTNLVLKKNTNYDLGTL